MKGNIEKQVIKKKENNILGSSIFYLCFQNAFQKNSCGAMTFFGESCTFGCHLLL
jgi:hypothetical protein